MNLINKAIAAAENDELASDWRKESAQYAPVIRELVARIMKLEKQLAAAQQGLDAQDAARYRWLREQPNDCSTPRIDICYWTCEDGDSVNTGEGLRLEAADKAIDAAIAAQAKHGEQANG